MCFCSLLWSGYKAPLNDKTVWDLNPSERAKPIIRIFYRSWLKSSKDRKQYKVNVDDSNYGACSLHDEKNTQGYANHAHEDDAMSEKTPLLGKQRPQVSTSEQKSKEFKTWKVNSSTFAALWNGFGLYFTLIGIYEVFNILLTFIRPLILE